MTAPTDRAGDDLARTFARHLSGRLAAHIAPEIVAAALVDLARDQGWRHVPRPVAPQAGTGAPPNPAWREAADRIRNKEPR